MLTEIILNGNTNLRTHADILRGLETVEVSVLGQRYTGKTEFETNTIIRFKKPPIVRVDNAFRTLEIKDNHFHLEGVDDKDLIVKIVGVR